MHLAQLKLGDSRNYPRLDAAFSPGFHMLVGDNAQGKTNILETIYLKSRAEQIRRGEAGGKAET